VREEKELFLSRSPTSSALDSNCCSRSIDQLIVVILSTKAILSAGSSIECSSYTAPSSATNKVSGLLRLEELGGSRGVVGQVT
jgi:hypothetical protein